MFRKLQRSMVPWSSGQDAALSRRKQEFDSPRNYSRHQDDGGFSFQSDGKNSIIGNRSSAGMSVRLTRERSWVRAPSVP